MECLNDIVKQAISNGDNIRELFQEFLVTANSKIGEVYGSILDEPDWDGIDIVDRSYIVASINKFMNDNSIECPRWIYNRKYVLEKPYFSLNAIGNLRLQLIWESPIEFKARNIFTSANTIDVV